MKKITGYIRDFIKQDFNLRLYLFVALFLAVCISLNYHFKFERKILNGLGHTTKCMIAYIGFYAFAYFMVAIPQALVTKADYLRKRNFWIKSILLLTLLGVDGGFYYHKDLLHNLKGLDSGEFYFLTTIINNAYRYVLYLPILITLKFVFDRNESGLYGLTLKKFDYKPYLYFLIAIAPVLFMLSFQADFQRSYPQMKPWISDAAFGWPEWKQSAVFEFFYLSDFVFVELFFRGALVIGMTLLMGRHAILPMVATYCFLHFGKPMAEAIGSIFGGYLLGVIALYSRNILGGYAIHMGLAALMEVMGLVQHYCFPKK